MDTWLERLNQWNVGEMARTTAIVSLLVCVACVLIDIVRRRK